MICCGSVCNIFACAPRRLQRWLLVPEVVFPYYGLVVGAGLWKPYLNCGAVHNINCLEI